MAGKTRFDYTNPLFLEKMREIYPQRGGSKILRDMFGVSESTICLKARELGILSDQRTRLKFYYESKKNGHFDAMLREWVLVDGGVTHLAKVFEVEDEIIRKEANKIGVCSPMAQTIRLHRITLKKDFFKTWDEVIAYYIGYIYADGCIAARGDYPYGLALKCKRDDEEIILKLRDLLGSSHSVKRGVRHNEDGSVIINKDGRPREYTTVTICSTELARSLIEDHGILPNKSYLDLPFPKNIPEDLLRHFVRGYFDGDGSCGVYDYEYLTSLKYVLNFIGTCQFIHGLQQQICSQINLNGVTPQLNVNSWYLQWQSLDDIRTLYNWMYPTPDVVCLPRKRLYLEYMLSGAPVPETGGEPMDDFDEAV